MSDDRSPPKCAPHEALMNFNEFDWYCEFNARPGVTPMTIIDELYERGLLGHHLFLRYMMFVQRIYWDNLEIVLEATADEADDVMVDDLRGFVAHD